MSNCPVEKDRITLAPVPSHLADDARVRSRSPSMDSRWSRLHGARAALELLGAGEGAAHIDTMAHQETEGQPATSSVQGFASLRDFINQPFPGDNSWRAALDATRVSIQVARSTLQSDVRQPSPTGCTRLLTDTELQEPVHVVERAVGKVRPYPVNSRAHPRHPELASCGGNGKHDEPRRHLQR
jgi:hypothetical protein